MHRLVLSNPFVALVAPILLGVLAHKLLSKRRTSAQRDAADQHPGMPSPPIQPSRNDFDVFLSFRDLDTRTGFTDYLYCSLIDVGIRVFMNNNEPRLGERLSEELMQAISNSNILIPIISENYASDKWCLQELVCMMECRKQWGHKVFPIFYKVEPAGVRSEMGCFREAFRNYKRRRFDPEVVAKWKEVLAEVSSLSGWESEKFANGREGELVKSVVQKVLKELKELVGNDYLVGIDSPVEEVMELVNKNASATMCVGIYGITGIGKTTLAKAIYNKLSDLFVHRSFIADIKVSCERNGINYLQNQLIFDMQKREIQFCNNDERIEYILSRFKDEKALIILDDVDTTSQLEALAGNPYWFGLGSRIFVTTRNESVLDRAGVDMKYEHKQMDEEQSLVLFSRHAFRRDHPPREFLALSHLVVSTMEGIPLAVKVVGSFLCEKPSRIWRETIRKMQNIPHMAVQEKFRIICEEMGDDRKNAEDASSVATPCPSILRNENDYEVFLSFRGVDTRRGFSDYLYCSLVDVGIRVFRDDDELREGESLSEDLIRAIRNSNVLIPIISVNYASSKWCLDELIEMMKSKNCSGHIVLPIFYKVEPTDVRDQKGQFGEAFHYSGRNFDQKSTKEWKQALIEVSSLPGWQFANGPVEELIKSVVQKVLNELKKAVNLDIPENLVGIDRHVEEVMKLINKCSGATLCVGIYGMGGIGKTTLVNVIYNKLLNQFEHCSFIADIRESCNRNDIRYLQNQLINDILQRNIRLHNKDHGIHIISSKLKDMKVLIILDDLETTDQLAALAGNLEWFGSGSRIFVTTRNGSVLDRAGVDIKYKHEEMGMEQALILFSRHAFRSDFPPSEFSSLAHVVVSITGGLPLVLKVVGSFLCGKPAMLWEETIHKMKRMPHKEVAEKLMVSYEELEEDQRQMFLDIACFLIGTDARVAYYMWDAWGFFARGGIEVLRSLLFISIGDNHEFRMHDQMRDLAREIVRAENYCKPHERSRLWHYEEALEVLEIKRGTGRIQAICLEQGNSNYIIDQASCTFTDEPFRNLSNLRFLHMSAVNLVGDFSKLFSQLRWLKWGNCPSNFEASNFHAGELVILDLSGSPISDVWQGWHSMMKAEKLKVLNLTSCHSLKGTPYLSAFKRLEILILKDCSALEQIDTCIGDMENLVSLDLSGCSLLERLPPQMAKLGQLKELLLDETAIQEIPSFISSLKKLETLVLSGCVELATLPNSIEFLDNLRGLSLGSCHQLREIPNSIGKLKLLTQLNLSGCSRLVELPPQMGELKQLKELRLDQTAIQEIPSSIGSLVKLEMLSARDCKSLIGLPDSIGNLCNLSTLVLSGCVELATLPNSIGFLENLRCLLLRSCHQLREIPSSIGKLKLLTQLDLSGCLCLVELPPQIGELKQLKELCLDQTPIQKIPSSIGSLEKLEMLSAKDCKLT
ncbi:disease resistance protein RUN1-like [Eucalyptus grandis]|uniref:disease resistance protein RUN1-like n=1 Tax=Eucalyptus grandis TaxID=71139 RepID=UPI00192ECE54|nr:disease resistance protein RUN1-like [Eucalyptus grandis]